ncbi:hypothetical protein VTI74DRAFT_3224 [Chaetomium olivicolor]
MRGLRVANGLLRSNASTGSLLRALSTGVVQKSAAPARCQLTISLHATAAWQLPTARPFSHTTKCEKRNRNNSNNNNNNAEAATPAPSASPKPKARQKTITTASSSSSDPSTDGERPQPNPEEPFDLSDLTFAFDRLEKRFTDDLKKLRTGGRFNADTIGAIAVQLDKKSAQTFPLRELATVAPLGGRRWSILAFEEASVKPIISAVQRSDNFNQQPQRSEDNPLELTMTVEPERADALAKRAKDLCQHWRTKVREEAHKRGELHKKWRAEKVILSDDLHSLKKELQKMQDERMKVILAKEKEAVQLIMAKAS